MGAGCCVVPCGARGSRFLLRGCQLHARVEIKEGRLAVRFKLNHLALAQHTTSRSSDGDKILTDKKADSHGHGAEPLSGAHLDSLRVEGPRRRRGVLRWRGDNPWRLVDGGRVDASLLRRALLAAARRHDAKLLRHLLAHSANSDELRRAQLEVN